MASELLSPVLSVATSPTRPDVGGLVRIRLNVLNRTTVAKIDNIPHYFTLGSFLPSLPGDTSTLLPALNSFLV